MFAPGFSAHASVESGQAHCGARAGSSSGGEERINPFNMPGENSPPSKKARRGSPVLPVDGVLHDRHDQEEDYRQPSPPHPSTCKRVIWRVPETSHTGSSWQIVDGFATPEECRALVADAKQGLADSLRQPLRRFEDPPLVGVKYRSADASSLASEALAALSARAANVTCVGVNKEKDSVMIAHTSARVTTTTRAAVLPGDEKDENADVGKEPGAAEGDGVGAAREGSVDSEGFLLREDHAKDGGVSRWARLVNVHHDHNRDELRACTVFVYLSDVEPIAGPADDADETERRKTPGGGTFFPCVMGDVDPREGDDVRARLALHGKRGTHVIFHDSRDGGAEEEASEGDALVAEFGTLSRGGVGVVAVSGVSGGAGAEAGAGLSLIHI